jgi:hypothetical protein
MDDILSDIVSHFIPDHHETSAPPSPALPAPENPRLPKLDYLAKLIDYVYTIAAGGKQDAPLGMDLLGQFVIPSDDNGCIAMLFRSQSLQSVAFLAIRGTSGLFEWGIDADFSQVPYPGIDGASVHKGFYESYQSGISNGLKQLLASTKDIETLFITGHSLGGALCILAAADIFSSNIGSVPHVLVTTFASPRVGNPVFAQTFDSKLTVMHIRAEDDVIPQLPLAENANGTHYEHLGQWCYFRRPQPSLIDSHSLLNYISFAETSDQTCGKNMDR